jgi:ParB family transcriptional regulator, chromosome partitioning protein
MTDLLNSQSNVSIKSAVEGFEIKHIPIENIKPSSKNNYGIRNIEEMAASIEMIGLLHNLVVRKVDNSIFYEIVSGERRYRGIKKLYEEGKEEWKTIPCKVERNKDDIFTELELLFANSTARELTDYEKTYQAGRIKEILTQLKKSGYKFTGRMRDIVAETINVSPAQMGRMESINEKLSPELKESFKEQDINITAAYELSRLPKEEQVKAFEVIKEKGELNIKDIKDKRSGSEKNDNKNIESHRQIEPIQDYLVNEPNAAETIKLLRSLADDIEKGNDGSNFDIKKICLDAIKLINNKN